MTATAAAVQRTLRFYTVWRWCDNFLHTGISIMFFQFCGTGTNFISDQRILDEKCHPIVLSDAFPVDSHICNFQRK